MHLRTWTTCVVAVAALAVFAAGAAAGPTGNYYGVCGKLSAGGKTLTIRTVNVRCPAARAVMAKVAKLPSPRVNTYYVGSFGGLRCAYLKRGGSSLYCTSLTPFRQVVGVIG